MRVLDPKTPDEVYDLEFEFRDLLLTAWTPGTQKSVGDFVRPTVPNGKEYEATVVTLPGTIGQTNSNEPTWPIAVGDTVVDGSVTWTCRAFGTSATDTISSQTATAPSGLTLGTPTSSGTVVTVRASAGIDGKDYLVTCQIVTAAGQTFEDSAVLPVRTPKQC